MACWKYRLLLGSPTSEEITDKVRNRDNIPKMTTKLSMEAKFFTELDN